MQVAAIYLRIPPGSSSESVLPRVVLGRPSFVSSFTSFPCQSADSSETTGLGIMTMACDLIQVECSFPRSRFNRAKIPCKSTKLAAAVVAPRANPIISRSPPPPGTGHPYDVSMLVNELETIKTHSQEDELRGKQSESPS